MYISPGGLRGFYTHGICKFIRHNYLLSNYTFHGASAGAWNSLYMSIKPDKIDEFEKIIVTSINKKKNLYTIQECMRSQILRDFTSEDFYLDKMVIQTYEWNWLRLKKKNYEYFDSLDDMINCCMASSHIPL